MDHETAVRLVGWFERRIDATVGFQMPHARLYGLVLNDARELDRDDPLAARVSFAGEDVDPYDLVAGPAGVLARSFDAAALVTTGWAGDIDGGRPSTQPGRRWMRVAALVSDAGVRSVIRFADASAAPLVINERGMGGLVDALEAMWFGDPFPTSGGGLVNARTTPPSCERRP